MPEEEEKRTDQLLEIAFSWSCPEFQKHPKGTFWYLISAVIFLLAVGWAILVANYLFAVFLILFYALILLYEFRGSKIVKCVLTPDGVEFGGYFYPYQDFKSFFIIYRENGTKKLYFNFRNPLRGRLAILLESQNPLSIRDFLNDFLKEDLDQEAEPLFDQIGRWLKF